MPTLQTASENLEGALAQEPPPPEVLPLTSEEVDALAFKTGKNRCQVVAEHQLQTCPPESLPPNVAKARRALDAVSEQQAAADAAFQDALRIDSELQAMRATVGAERAAVAAGEAELQASKNAVPLLEQSLDGWNSPFGRPGQARETLIQIVATERMIKYLPGWVTRRRQMLADAEKELAEFEKENGIKPA